MKSIFIDCNNQLAPVFARVRRPDDPPIAVNSDAFQSADLPRLLAGYDVCLDDHSYMPTEVMAQCRGLKHLVFLGTGAASYMDVPALNGLGIKVHTIKGYGDIAVAEHTMALIFACCRDLARMDRAVRGGVWDPLESMQLNGKTLGLVGLGGIGQEVARIARGVGMEVIGWNRSARPEVGVPLVGLDELLARADVISLHLALNEETRGFIDAKRLARTKRGVILVNTARGALVEEAALLDALASGHIRHAGLDVFHAEPLKRDHALARMENVTLTSHAAFRTLEASETLMRRAIDSVRGIATLNMRLSEPELLVDINAIGGLDRIVLKNAHVEIGALVRYAQAERSTEIARAAPLIALALPHIGHPAIRNRGTVGGSLAFADPAAALPACVVALAGEIEIVGPQGQLAVKADDFFKRLFETALTPRDVLTAVRVPAAGTDTRVGFAELARRHGDYAMVGLAACARADG